MCERDFARDESGGRTMGHETPRTKGLEASMEEDVFDAATAESQPEVLVHAHLPSPVIDGP
jgi:hypothetical protein